jgi:hypothetical protein
MLLIALAICCGWISHSPGVARRGRPRACAPWDRAATPGRDASPHASDREGAFGVAWDDPAAVRWSANPLDMPGPERDAGFLASGGRETPTVAWLLVGRHCGRIVGNCEAVQFHLRPARSEKSARAMLPCAPANTKRYQPRAALLRRSVSATRRIQRRSNSRGFFGPRALWARLILCPCQSFSSTVGLRRRKNAVVPMVLASVHSSSPTRKS